ncbi:MAG: hypothetical protein JKP96_06630 [Oceanicaulis sp.]|jgi:hypothetical protein|nr:hypothetical protein [Oceanicaulis sp.]
MTAQFRIYSPKLNEPQMITAQTPDDARKIFLERFPKTPVTKVKRAR